MRREGPDRSRAAQIVARALRARRALLRRLAIGEAVSERPISMRRRRAPAPPPTPRSE